MDLSVTYGLYLATLGILCYVFISSTRVRSQLKHLRSKIDQLQQGSVSFEEVDQAFLASSERIRNSWLCFQRQLLFRDGRQYRCCDSADYFHSNEIIDPALALEFVRHVPGMLTGVGIICTFFGMKNGLGKAGEALKAGPGPTATPAPGAAGSDGVAKLQNMTAGLLEQIQPAVGLSLTAVMCAIGFLFLERVIYSTVHYRLEQLQRSLNIAFPRLSESHILQSVEQLSVQLCEQSEQTMNSLKGLNTDFAVMLERAMSNAMKPLVEYQTTQFQASHGTLTSAVSQMNTELVTALEKIQDQAQDASNEALQGMVSTFQDSLLQNSQGQIQDMLRAIEGVSVILQGQREAQDRFVLNLSERLQAEEERYQRQQETAFSHSSEAVRTATTSLERLLAGLDGPLSQFQNLSTNYNQQSNNLEALGRQIHDTADKLHQGALSLSASVQESKLQRQQTEQSLALASKQAEALDAYNRNLTNALQSLREQATQLSQLVQDLGQQSQEAFRSMRSDTEGFRVALTGSAQEFLGETEKVLSKGLSSLSGAIEELAEQVEDLRDLREGSRT